MRILVVGSGAREHALCWAVKESPLCKALYCAPGNAGIATLATCANINAEDLPGLVHFAQQEKIDFVIVGPDAPVVMGLVDALNAVGIKAFGPTKTAAELEGSKAFMKEQCARFGIPTAVFQRFTDAQKAKAYAQKQGAPIVIKTSGLAAGKGVTVAHTIEEAFTAIDDALVHKKFGVSGDEIVIEEFLAGEELSFFALCDGHTALPFSTAQDHKAAFDGDKGPNTGGMGAYSPAHMMTPALEKQIMDQMVHPMIQGLKKQGKPFRGILFVGVMMTAKGPKLLEYNVRFGDPECQAMLCRLDSDLLPALLAAADGHLKEGMLRWKKETALCVVMATGGYPGPAPKGTVVRGLDKAAQIKNTILFQAGTSKNTQGEIIAGSTRVLGIVGLGSTVIEAQKTAYAAVNCIDWPEGFCRRDIGWRAVDREKALHNT